MSTVSTPPLALTNGFVNVALTVALVVVVLIILGAYPLVKTIARHNKFKKSKQSGK
jgi:hypothetical protein